MVPARGIHCGPARGPAARGIRQNSGTHWAPPALTGKDAAQHCPRPPGASVQARSAALVGGPGPQVEAQRPRPGPPTRSLDPGGTCKRRHPFRSTSWQLLPATPNFFWLCRARSLNVLGFRDNADILRAFGASGRTCLAGRSGASSPRLQGPGSSGTPRGGRRPRAARGNSITQKARKSGGAASPCAQAPLSHPAPKLHYPEGLGERRRGTAFCAGAGGPERIRAGAEAGPARAGCHESRGRGPGAGRRRPRLLFCSHSRCDSGVRARQGRRRRRHLSSATGASLPRVGGGPWGS